MSLVPFATGALESLGFTLLDSLFSVSPRRSIQWQASDQFGNPVLDATGQPVPTALYPQVVLRELGTDRLRITRHPVEVGTTITDHAFKEPASVEVRGAWARSSQPGLLSGLPAPFNTLSSVVPVATDPSYLTNLYNSLLAIQANRALVTLVTGKRLYRNMMLESLSVDTDHETENVLNFTAVFEEMLFAITQVISVPSASVMKAPSSNAATTNLGNTALTSGANANVGALNSSVGPALQNPATGG